MASALSSRAALCLCLAAAASAAAASELELGKKKGREGLLKGISYGPVPLRSQDGVSLLPADDWFCDEAVPMWGRAGRGDLRVISSMGANMVRLYGNNPAADHTTFLDEALAEGLSVAPGMSDYPFYQMPGSCRSSTDFNCFSQVKPLYLQNLNNGFLTADRRYHPALKYMNILNEPDLKMPPGADNGGQEDTGKMARSLVSAFDAMLEAEKEAEVTGPLINFTATFSYAVCKSCEGFAGRPALGMIWVLDDAMHNPEKYGYTPINNISAAYAARFTHSFNTQNPATDLQHQFLDDYSAHFTATPVYIGEYHNVNANLTQDVELILSLAESNPLFLGISFFQYQVAYWKTGSEMDFGMFGLGDFVLAQMPYFGQNFEVHCLALEPSPSSGKSMPDAVAEVFGGSSIDTSGLCAANPLHVTLNQEGFLQVLSQKSESQMSLFIERVANHMGATIPAHARKRLNDLAASVVDGSVNNGKGLSMSELASFFGSGPEWLEFDSGARCVANRMMPPSVIGPAVEWACSQATSFSCDEVLAQCQSNIYKTADFVFSRYYNELGATHPLVGCSFSGAAIYAPSEIHGKWSDSAECAADPATPVPTTQTHSSTSASVESATTTTTMSASGFLQPSKLENSMELTSSAPKAAAGKLVLALFALLSTFTVLG